MNPAEREFAGKLDAQGKRWLFEPTRFRLPEPYRSYTPDFYVVDDDTFVEVVGTRQAFSYNRKTYDAFRATYPRLRFKVVNVGAWKRGENPKRVDEPVSRKIFNRIKPGELPLPLFKRAQNGPNAVASSVIELVMSGRFRNVAHIAEHFSIPRHTLYGYMRTNGKHNYLTTQGLLGILNGGTKDKVIGQVQTSA